MKQQMSVNFDKGSIQIEYEEYGSEDYWLLLDDTLSEAVRRGWITSEQATAHLASEMGQHYDYLKEKDEKGNRVPRDCPATMTIGAVTAQCRELIWQWDKTGEPVDDMTHGFHKATVEGTTEGGRKQSTSLIWETSSGHSEG